MARDGNSHQKQHKFKLKGTKPWKSNAVKYEEEDGTRVTEFTMSRKQVKRFNGRKVVDPKLLEKYSKGEGSSIITVRVNTIGNQIYKYCIVVVNWI